MVVKKQIIMKRTGKFLYVLLLLTLTTSVLAANTDKTSFKFPFSQEDEKWKEYKTPLDRIAALQIPEDILATIPTEELIDCCLDFPYLSDAIFFDDINEGFNTIVSKFNGFRELLKREDRTDALIKTFGLISLENMYLGDKTTIEIGSNSLKICILAYMVGREEILGRLTSVQKDSLLQYIDNQNKTLLQYPSFKNTFGGLAINELRNTLQGRDRYISGDYYSITIYTPNGSPVLAWRLYQNELSEVDKAQYAYYAVHNYGATIIAEATKTYNCHGYAWHMVEDGIPVCIGLNSFTDENIYWTDGSYVEVDESLATIVSYDENTANHSAVRITNNLYRSKWGAGPLVEHAPNSCPYYTTMPKKYYRGISHISGPTVPCVSNDYYVNIVPNGYTAEWSLAPSSTNLVIEDIPPTIYGPDPNTNQCSVMKEIGYYAKGTLIAKLKENGIVKATLTKVLDTGAYLSATWSQGLTSDTLLSGHAYPIQGGSTVYLQSYDFVGATVSYSSTMLLLGGVSHNNGTISFLPPTIPLPRDMNSQHPQLNNSIVITVTKSGTCEAYQFTFYLEGYTPFNDSDAMLNVNQTGNEYTFTIKQSEDETSTGRNSPWQLEIVRYDTGQSVYKTQTSNTTINVNTAGWTSGVYVAVATKNGQKMTKKLFIQ